MPDRWPEAEQIAHRAARWTQARRWPGEFDDWHQEALLAAWVAHRAFDDRKGPYARWIDYSVRQRLLDALRRYNHELPPGHRLDGLPAVLPHVLPDRRAPEDGPGPEYRDLLTELARHLTPAERRVLLATWAGGGGRRQVDVSAALGRSQAHVSSLQRSAYAALRQIGPAWASS